MTAARRALLREMSAAWSELNVTLQIIGEAVHKTSIFGAGRRLRAQRTEDELELADHE